MWINASRLYCCSDSKLTALVPIIYLISIITFCSSSSSYILSKYESNWAIVKSSSLLSLEISALLWDAYQCFVHFTMWCCKLNNNCSRWGFNSWGIMATLFIIFDAYYRLSQYTNFVIFVLESKSDSIILKKYLYLITF